MAKIEEIFEQSNRYSILKTRLSCFQSILLGASLRLGHEKGSGWCAQVFSRITKVVALIKRAVENLFSWASLTVLLAIAANVPIVQFAVLGYLLESGGRVARSGKFGSGVIGRQQAATLGRIAACVVIVLLPLRLVTAWWVDASVIDPESIQTWRMAVLQRVLWVSSLAHIASAIMCGGRVRHFFWPLRGLWLGGRNSVVGSLRWSGVLRRRDLEDGLSRDNCGPESDSWCVPIIVFQRFRRVRLYRQLRDDTVAFVARLKLPMLFSLGVRGFLGSMLWLVVPTFLMVAANSPWPAIGGVGVFLGVLLAAPVFLLLPILQIQFAFDGKIRSLLDWRSAWSKWRCAPVASLLAMVVMLLVSIPLFLLKVERIPTELFWLLSVLFIGIGWPSRLVWGRVFHYATSRPAPASWQLRFPVAVTAVGSALVFAVFFFLTRYTSWNGTSSLFENHVFLLPIPFGISF